MKCLSEINAYVQDFLQLLKQKCFNIIGEHLFTQLLELNAKKFEASVTRDLFII